MNQQPRRSFLKSFAAIAAAAGMFGATFRARAAQGSAAVRHAVAGGSRYFSRAVAYDRIVFVAGVVGRDDRTGELASPDFEPQCRQALTNLKASVEAAGSSLDKVLKCNCFLTDAADFVAFNKIYAESFPSDPLARSTVVVKELVLAGAKIEIDCVTHV